MSPESVTAEWVYRALKADIVRGRFPPGSALNVHAVATELDLSISPVRDALNRLIGEGAIATRPGGGFRLPLLDEHMTRDLYAWHASLIHGALLCSRPFDDPCGVEARITGVDEADPVAMAEVATSLFAWFATASGNREHVRAVRLAGDRLMPLRVREDGLADRKAELLALTNRARSETLGSLRRAVARYHRRRIVQARQLVDRLYRPFPSP